MLKICELVEDELESNCGTILDDDLDVLEHDAHGGPNPQNKFVTKFSETER